MNMKKCISNSLLLVLILSGILYSACTGLPDVEFTKSYVSFVIADEDLAKTSTDEYGDYDLNSIVEDGFIASLYYNAADGTQSRYLAESQRVPHFDNIGKKDYLFHFSPVVYWPSAGTVDTYAIFPTNLSIDSDTKSVSFSNFDCAVDFFAGRTMKVSPSDAVVSETDPTKKMIPLKFERPLSWLYGFEVKLIVDNSAKVYYGTKADQIKLRVNAIRISGPDSGTFTFFTGDEPFAGSWSNVSGSQTYNVLSTPTALLPQDEYSDVLKNRYYFIPQGDYKLVVNYSIMFDGLALYTANGTLDMKGKQNEESSAGEKVFASGKRTTIQVEAHMGFEPYLVFVVQSDPDDPFANMEWQELDADD